MEYKYIQCVLKKDSNIIMNVESLENIKYLNKERWDIVEIVEILAEEQTLLNVCGNARVCGNALVGGNAQVGGNARVCGNALVGGNARVWDNAIVGGNAQVGGNARVWDNAQVGSDAIVCGNARVRDNAQVWGDARVRDNAQVWGNAQVRDNAIVRGNAQVWGNAIVRGNAIVGGDAIATTDVFNLTFLNYNVTLTDNHIEIGCKQWTYEEALRLNEIHIGLEYSKDEYDGMKNAKQVLIEMIKLKRPDLFEKENKKEGK